MVFMAEGDKSNFQELQKHYGGKQPRIRVQGIIIFTIIILVIVFFLVPFIWGLIATLSFGWETILGLILVVIIGVITLFSKLMGDEKTKNEGS